MQWRILSDISELNSLFQEFHTIPLGTDNILTRKQTQPNGMHILNYIKKIFRVAHVIDGWVFLGEHKYTIKACLSQACVTRSLSNR